MADKHYVVIGNGPAGRQAALTLRENFSESRVTVISRELGSTYLPKLLPGMIAGQIKKEEIYSCPIGKYQEEGIKLRCGQRVAGLNSAKREIYLGHKEVIGYDGLIIAVGGRPYIPHKLHASADNLYTLKTLRDAQLWSERLQEVDSVLIVGGDLVSLAVTKVLLEMGKKITFILNRDAFWPLRCTPEMYADMAAKLTAKGVEVLQERNIKSVKVVDAKTYAVRVDDKTLEFGMVGAFYGYEPDIDCLADSGLRLDRGILVDEHLFTGVDSIYAAGDCAQIFHPAINGYWVSIGHDNARRLGRIAAMNLAGDAGDEAKPESILNVQGINVNTSWWTEF